MLELLKIELNLKAVESLIEASKTARERERLRQLKQSLLMELEDYYKRLQYEVSTQILH